MKILIILFRVVAVIMIAAAAFFGYSQSGKLTDMTKKRDAVLADQRAVASTLVDMEDQRDSLQTELKSTEKEHKKLKSDHAKSKSMLTKAESKIDDLKGVISEKDSELDDAESKLSKVKMQLKTAKNATSDFSKQEYEKLLASNSQMSTEIEELKSDIYSLKKHSENRPSQIKNSSNGGPAATILALESDAGLLLIAAGSNVGISKNATYMVRKDNCRVAKITIIEAGETRSIGSIHPNYGVPNLLHANDNITLSLN